MLSRGTAPPLWAYACLAASMALVGSYVGLSKLLVAVFPVFLLAWLRFGIAAHGDAALGAPPRPARRRCRATTAVLLFWESFLGNFLFSICMLYGVALTSALAAGVVMAAIPAAVACCRACSCTSASRARDRRPSPAPWPASCCWRCANRGDRRSRRHVAAGAMLLLVGAVLCEASYVVIGKRLTGKVSPGASAR